MTPKQIVAELDKHIVGQDDAKRAVAIALRNRWRRSQIQDPLRQEITPKNILMIGPTGVGKTEIARRLAKLANAPFVKVEATKFTEVGYVGRDVESMVRDLVDSAVNMVRTDREDDVQEVAEQRVEERLLDLLIPPVEGAEKPVPPADPPAGGDSPRVFVAAPGGQVERNCSAARRSSSGAPSGAGAGRCGGKRRSRSCSSTFASACCRTSACFSRRTMSTADSVRSRTIDSTSRPT